MPGKWDSLSKWAPCFNSWTISETPLPNFSFEWINVAGPQIECSRLTHPNTKSNNHHTTVRSSSINVLYCVTHLQYVQSGHVYGGPPDERLRSNKLATLSPVPKRFPFIQVVLLQLNLLTQTATCPCFVVRCPPFRQEPLAPLGSTPLSIHPSPDPLSLRLLVKMVNGCQVRGRSGFGTANEKMDPDRFQFRTVNEKMMKSEPKPVPYMGRVWI